MIVGVLRIDLAIREARSLKDKRHAIKGLKQRLRDRFNVSVAEVDHHDVHQRCTLGLAMVANESRAMHSQFDKMVDLVRGAPRVSLLDYEREFY
jgi:uncharacterized protein